jgi:hypothetical protein
MSHFGVCNKLPRRIGIHQDSVLSCLLALVVLDPVHRAALRPRNAFYCYQALPELKLEPKAFSDDEIIHAQGIGALKNIIRPANHMRNAIGIGYDPSKCHIYLYNDVAHDFATAEPIAIRNYNRLTGKCELIHIPIVRGETAKYKLLGVHYKGFEVDRNKKQTALDRITYLIKRLQYQRLNPDEFKLILESTIISKMSSYTPLLQDLSLGTISSIDTLISAAAKENSHIPLFSYRGLPFMPPQLGGLGITSVLKYLVKGIVRELLLLLNGTGTLTSIAQLEIRNRPTANARNTQGPLHNAAYFLA